MIFPLGTVRPGSKIQIPVNTFDSNDPSASVTITNWANTDCHVHKNGGTTQRSSSNGETLSIDFDGITGNHILDIDLADNSDAGFYTAGSRYAVRIEGTTVDAATLNAWIGSWYIGYPGALLDTTISILGASTNQMVFDLSDGPPEDDALNGMWAVIHDAAHATQCAYVIIEDYIGNSKTVILAANPSFGVEAGDNFSVLGPMPVQATLQKLHGAGRTLDIQPTGEVDANVTLFGNAAGTFDAGRPEVNTSHVSGTAQTAGDIVADTEATLTDTEAVLTDSEAVLVDSEAIITDTETGITERATLLTDTEAILTDTEAVLADTEANVGVLADTEAILADTEVTTTTTIADQVWDEAQADHVAAGSFGLIANETAAILADTEAIITDTETGITERATLLTDTEAVLADTEAAAPVLTDTEAILADSEATLADTNELQTDWANGGRLDLIIDAILADTEALSAGSGLTALATGTAQSGTASTIVLAASSAFADDILNGNVIKIHTGTGAGQSRLILSNTLADDTCNVTPNWTTNPSSDSQYEIVEGAANLTAVSLTAQTAGDIIADTEAVLSDTELILTDAEAILVDTEAAGVPPTVAAIADGVWDEAQSGHVAAGSFGETATEIASILTDSEAVLADSEAILADTEAATPVLTDTEAILADTETGITERATLLADTEAVLADTNELQTDWTNAGRLDTILDAVLADTEAAIPVLTDTEAILADSEAILTDSEAVLVDTEASLWTTQMADSVAADGTIATREQAMYMLLQFMTERSYSGTTVQVKKVDGSTNLFSCTISDDTTPTSITRS